MPRHRRRARYCPHREQPTPEAQPTRYVAADPEQRARWFAAFRAQLGVGRPDDNPTPPPIGQLDIPLADPPRT